MFWFALTLDGRAQPSLELVRHVLRPMKWASARIKPQVAIAPEFIR